MQLLQTLSWAYKDGDFYENCCKLVKSMKNIKKKKKRTICLKSDPWIFDGSQTKPLWKLGILQKILLLKVFFI